MNVAKPKLLSFHTNTLRPQSIGQDTGLSYSNKPFYVYFCLFYSVQQLTKPSVAIRFSSILAAHINALTPTFPFIFKYLLLL